jgi:hypothetical protein
MSDIKIHLRKADGRRALRQFNGHNRKSKLYQRKYCDREPTYLLLHRSRSLIHWLFP